MYFIYFSLSYYFCPEFHLSRLRRFEELQSLASDGVPVNATGLSSDWVIQMAVQIHLLRFFAHMSHMRHMSIISKIFSTQIQDMVRHAVFFHLPASCSWGEYHQANAKSAGLYRVSPMVFNKNNKTSTRNIKKQWIHLGQWAFFRWSPAESNTISMVSPARFHTYNV